MVAGPVTAAADWPVLSDAAGGVTCGFFNAGARLAWERPGGDWLDASGERFGPKPFASAPVAQADEFVSWDLSHLARRWTDGSSPPGVVILRADPSSRSSSSTFDSREAPSPGNAPTLALRWDDGQKQRLSPSVDTYLNCTTIRSLGEGPTFKVGDGNTGLLAFPLSVRPGRSIAEATLTARSAKVRGRGLSIEAFAAAPLAGPAGNERQPGLSDSFERDKGLERNSDVWLADRFDSAASLRRVDSDSHAHESLALIAKSDDSGFEPIDGAALRVRIRRGTRQALNHQFRMAALNGGVEPEEAYFRYHLRLGSDWNPLVDGGKLPGFAGTYGRAGWGMRKSDGTNGWSARGAFFQIRPEQKSQLQRGIGTYAYTAGTDDQSGEVWGWNRGPTGVLPKNRWVAIEQQVRMNTVGRDDGVLRVWIDGQLAFERTNIRWRTVPDLKVEAVWFNVYHGGTAKADRDMTLYIDNLVIARKPIGPGRFDKP